MEKIKLCYHSLQKLKKIKSSSIHYLKHELDSFMIIVSTSQMCLLVFNYNLKESPLFHYLTTLTFYNAKNNDKMCLFCYFELFVNVKYVSLFNISCIVQQTCVRCPQKVREQKNFLFSLFGVTCSSTCIVLSNSIFVHKHYQ